MNVIEAVKQSIETKKFIYRPDCPHAVISYDGFTFMCTTFGKCVQKEHLRWSPTANDLLYDNWQLVESYCDIRKKTVSGN